MEIYVQNKNRYKTNKVPPRFELGSLDSESKVITVTPRNLLVNDVITTLKSGLVFKRYYVVGIGKQKFVVKDMIVMFIITDNANRKLTLKT